MITLLVLINFFSAIATASKMLPTLIVAARASRGYLPETLDARERALSKTFDVSARKSTLLKVALKARLRGTFTFLTLCRPAIAIYAELSSLFFFPGSKDARINERLHSAAKHLARGVPRILKSIKEAYAILPGWNEAFDSTYDSLARDVVMHVDDITSSLTSLLRKQNLKLIFTARANLLAPLFQPIITLLEKLEIAVMTSEVAGMSPRELLHSMSESITADTESLHLWDWSIRYFTNKGIEEIDVLTSGDKVRHELINALRSSVYSILLLEEYGSRIPRCPTFDWRTGTYPGDRLNLAGSQASATKGAHSRLNQRRAMERWIDLVTGLFKKSFNLNPDDKVMLAQFAIELREAGANRAEAEVDMMIRRQVFINEGLKYLK